MDAAGFNMAELARRSGVNYDSINKYVNGGVDQPRGNNLAMLAMALGVDEIWLRDGVQIVATNGERKRGTAQKEVVDSFVQSRILELDFRGGSGGGGMDSHTFNRPAGRGIAVDSDAVSAEWGIPTQYVRGQLRINPANAWIVEIYGDSMYDPANPGAPGSLFPTDRVIVDTGDTRPSPPGAFAVWDGVGLVVKLVEVLPNTEPAMIRLSSRNPAYRAYEVASDEGRIIGRVRGRISAM